MQQAAAPLPVGETGEGRGQAKSMRVGAGAQAQRGASAASIWLVGREGQRPMASLLECYSNSRVTSTFLAFNGTLDDGGTASTWAISLAINQIGVRTRGGDRETAG